MILSIKGFTYTSADGQLQVTAFVHGQCVLCVCVCVCVIVCVLHHRCINPILKFSAMGGM